MLLVNRKTDLRFNRDLEKEYLNYSSKKDKKYIRIAYILSSYYMDYFQLWIII